MNTYTIIAYIFIVGLFFSALYANISESQTERQKILITYLVLGFVYIVMLFIPAYRDNYSPTIGIDFMAFGAMLPQFIARLINGRRLYNIVLRLKINLLNLIFSLVGIGFMVFLTWMFLHPNSISVVDGKPIYDYEYFRTRISFLLATVSASIYFFLLAIERPTVLSNGIFYRGLHWDWSDFQSYTWKRPSNNSVPELILKTKKLWFFQQVKFKIPFDNMAQVESILAREVINKG